MGMIRKSALALVLGGMASLAMAQEPMAVRLAHGESLNVVVYGTSLTAGGAWSQQVADALKERYLGHAIWTNAAKSGMNSDWGLENLNERVLPKNPDVVFIEFSVNDSVARFNLPVSRARKNLETMIDRLRVQNPKVDIILQITNPVIGRPAGDPGHRPHLDTYFEMVREMAKRKGTRLIDHEAAWQRVLNRGDEAYKKLVPDGLHPSPAGYRQVVRDTVLESLGTWEADAIEQADKVFDIVVYGGTSAAVTAAVQAKRMGKSVLLISPDVHLGGLTSGGLGWTDSGDIRTIGGLSKEFYHRIYEHYGKEDNWYWQPKNSFKSAAQGTKARDDKTQTMWLFEPHVAEGIFDAMIEEARIPVVHGRLDLNDGVLKMGKKIVGIRTEAGHKYVGVTFIDATYEGDLMAKAGVSYTVGREANAQYGETLNGVQTGHALKNQVPKGISAFRRAGDPKSGLLAGVEPFDASEDGSADARIQAYCYRMCLTNSPNNRIKVEKPKGYRESDYEILIRSIEAGQTGTFFKLDAIPNMKTDSNNSGGLSTDFIGRNYDYPDAGYAQREAIAKAHEDWQKGLLWTLQNSPRVPESIRKKYADWGLPNDEFVDHGGWPHQLYIREARRMLGEVVATEGSLRDKSREVNSVGMGSYNMDSHNVRRMAREDGTLMNEGDVQQSAGGAYRIDYGCLLPRETECPNLIVPVCVSATHIAYGSIRMEPVFMILGQSAGTAAALSMDDYVPVQRLDYHKLQKRLRKDGQVLDLAK